MGILAQSPGGNGKFFLLDSTSSTAATWSSPTLVASAYREFKIVARVAANAGTVPYIRFNGDTGANYNSGGQYVAPGLSANWFGATAFTGALNGDRSIVALGGDATSDLNAIITVLPLGTPGSNRKRFFFQSNTDVTPTTLTGSTICTGSGYWNSASAITGISLTWGASVAFTIELWGLPVGR